MTARLSFARERINVLLLEGINQSAVDYFKSSGYTNVVHMPKALDKADLIEAISSAHIVGIRSRTQLTDEVFEAAQRLIAVGCYSVGTNQVDLKAARKRGIPVFNAPFSNTRSVAELVIGEIIMLMRRIFPRSNSAHIGGWDKSAAGSREVRGKTLGIVGYGNIGSQVGNLAESLGMSVRYFDMTDKLQYGNVIPTETLDELLEISDVVSLHVPSTKSTAKMITEAKLRKMKKGAFLINNARGSVVDLEALAKVLKEGHLAGAAIDVFPVEPASNKDPFVSPLQGWRMSFSLRISVVRLKKRRNALVWKSPASWSSIPMLARRSVRLISRRCSCLHAQAARVSCMCMKTVRASSTASSIFSPRTTSTSSASFYRPMVKSATL